jgi:hypothetical protein
MQLDISVALFASIGAPTELATNMPTTRIAQRDEIKLATDTFLLCCVYFATIVVVAASVSFFCDFFILKLPYENGQKTTLLAFGCNLAVYLVLNFEL